MPPDSDVGQYSRLFQAAAMEDSDCMIMFDLVHFANDHVDLDNLELQTLLRFLRSRCERVLYSTERPATAAFLTVQFGIARLIALKAKDVGKCVQFLTHFSISWPLCQQLPPGQSVIDLIDLIDAGKQAPMVKDEPQILLIRLLAVCFILTKKPAQALSILSQVQDSDEHLCLLNSIALYYKAKTFDDASLFDLALDALSPELDGKSTGTNLYALHFMKGFLLCCELRFIEAIGSFKTCLSGDYRRHEACLMIGVCLIEAESLDNAMDFLQRAVMNKQIEISVAFNVAVVKELQSNFEEAFGIQSAILEESINGSEEILSREAVIIRLINLCLIQNKTTEALKFVDIVISESRTSLEIARIHIYVLLSCGDRYETVLSHCDSYLSTYKNDIVLLTYLSEALFALQRFDDSIAKCDQIISACSNMQDSKARQTTEPKRKERKIRDGPVGYHAVSDFNFAEMKAQAYMNKGLCFACLNRLDQAISMMQWALFHYQSKEAEFNLCVLLIKTGRVDIGCARWLQHKGIDLSLSGQAYKEQIDRLADISGCIRPRSHVAGHLTDEQERTMTKLILERWIKIRSDHVFTKSLQDILQSC